MSKYIKHNHDCTEANHENIKGLNDQLKAQQQEFRKQLGLHKHRIETLEDNLHTAACTIKELNTEIQTQRREIHLLQS